MPRTPKTLFISSFSSQACMDYYASWVLSSDCSAEARLAITEAGKSNWHDTHIYVSSFFIFGQK